VPDDGHTGHSHGSEQPGSVLLEQLDMDTATGILAPSTKSDDFFEPFTQTNYWGRQSITLDAPATGAYYLVIWPPTGPTGKYVMDTGYAEVFGPTDLLRFPVWWVQTKMYFGDWSWLGYLAVIGLLAAATSILLRRRRTQRWQPATNQA
jgi:hypothetical protein